MDNVDKLDFNKWVNYKDFVSEGSINDFNCRYKSIHKLNKRGIKRYSSERSIKRNIQHCIKSKFSCVFIKSRL